MHVVSPTIVDKNPCSGIKGLEGSPTPELTRTSASFHWTLYAIKVS
jgi:hypothetical protein